MDSIFYPGGREPVSLFVSDTHLFHKFNGALDTQGHIIHQSRADRLYLLGDIIDFQFLQELFLKLMKAEGLTETEIPTRFEEAVDMLPDADFEKHMRFWDMIMANIADGMEVHYITGNHDNNLDVLHGMTYNGITFHDHMVETFGDVKTHLEHGDENDPAALINYGGLYARACKVLDMGLVLDHRIKRLFNLIASETGQYAFPVTNALKKLGKFFIKSFRENAVRRAMERGASAAVLGHIHRADIRDMKAPKATVIVEDNGFVYRNTGDGLTHGTAIIYNGQRTPQTPDGWNIVTRRDIRPDNAFHPDYENPFANYRAHTLDFLQTCWDTFLFTTDMETKWDHNSHRKFQTVLVKTFDTASGEAKPKPIPEHPPETVAEPIPEPV